MGVRLYCADCGKPVSSELPAHMTVTEGCATCWDCFRKKAQYIEGLERSVKDLQAIVAGLKTQLDYIDAHL